MSFVIHIFFSGHDPLRIEKYSIINVNKHNGLVLTINNKLRYPIPIMSQFIFYQ